ncbi:small multi-drug export protein [Paenibacillus elgii]|uniref:DNA-binding protein n=1 Tax=Paenibacillus elgii TaxID=189691 RepID=A0A165Q672_9BACL|nr:small multi-drug export protein [Paenibacillus elgii]KZE73762.1 DNA-binding protein [Paenibacillus elgii]NEN86499.1 small multi-drug export protein [Paenibacillus elgii]
MIAEFLKEWSYLAVFVLAALPWVESAFVVVLGIAMLNLNPVAATIMAFLGNWITVLLVVFLFDRWNAWRSKRSGASESKRSERAYRLFVRYGLPGLAFLGPILIGTEIAAGFAMLFKAPRGPVLFWMTCSLAFWTILFAAAAAYGVDLFGLTRMNQ